LSLNNQQLHTEFGDLALIRRPKRERETLQPWDAADEYILHYLSENRPTTSSRILIVNDSFGALSTALAEYPCTLWTDSAISTLCAEENTALNQRPKPHIIPATAIPGLDYDYVIYKQPKSRSLLQYQLQHLRPICHNKAQFIGAALARHIDQHSVAVFAKSIGTARPSLARKKARLIMLQSVNEDEPIKSDSKHLQLADLDLQLENRANVFSRDKLDQGSRLLLSALPSLVAPDHIADLGCGNGLLGISAARLWPAAKLHFFDDSFLAIDSAKANLLSNVPEAENKATFSISDCLHNYEGETFDLIICNPPFHQDHHVGDHIARQMFRDSRRHLSENGQLCVVGNRHMGYHILLKKLFGNCQTITSDSKFVVLLARL
jgi:23S rRNA (guanine1835-N2)-methyltransferase